VEGKIKMELVKRAKIIQQVLTKPPEPEKEEVSVETVISTGSTLLDLAISGRRRKGGGIPGGILTEIFGPSGWGKTTLLSEICASAQNQGGFALIGDVERRLNPDFIRYMGLQITDKNLRQPVTVDDLQEMILEAPESGNGQIDVVGVDGIASLISTQEMKTKKVKDEEGNVHEEVIGTKQDKRGSAKAKDLHSLCRRAKTEISKSNRLVVFTNQVQIKQEEFQSFTPQMYKEKTPGGDAIPYYASLRMRIGPAKESHITKEIKVGGKTIKKTIGVRSNVYIWKSSICAPYASADVCIVFDYGVDDIRSNLEYIREMSGYKNYWAVDRECQSIDSAIQNIEEQSFQQQLKDATISMWEEIETKFKFNRQPKQR
jgi:RecA/RadA recombinase